MRDKNDSRVKFANDILYLLLTNELLLRKVENKVNKTNHKEFILSIKDDIELMYNGFNEFIKNFYEVEEYIPLIQLYKFYTNFEGCFDVDYINEELELTIQQFEEKLKSDFDNFVAR